MILVISGVKSSEPPAPPANKLPENVPSVPDLSQTRHPQQLPENVHPSL
jgi:hypothetical protein